jgi:hypothetical protein
MWIGGAAVCALSEIAMRNGQRETRAEIVHYAQAREVGGNPSELCHTNQ